jgi:hypothetical protein
LSSKRAVRSVAIASSKRFFSSATSRCDSAELLEAPSPMADSIALLARQARNRLMPSMAAKTSQTRMIRPRRAPADPSGRWS